MFLGRDIFDAADSPLSIYTCVHPFDVKQLVRGTTLMLGSAVIMLARIYPNY